MIQVVALIGALFLVALNGFFVAAEFGLVKLRQTRVQSLAARHGMRGRLLAKVHGRLDAYLSACQLGITLASLGLGWIGEPAFAELITPLFKLVGVESEKADSRHFAVLRVLVHFVPAHRGGRTGAEVAGHSRGGEGFAVGRHAAVRFLLGDVSGIWVLNSSANAVLRIAGLDADHGHDSHYSTEELKLILRGRRANVATELGSPEGAYSQDEWNTIAHSLDFSRMTVSDLMRPAYEMVGLRRDLPLRENMQMVAQHRFSRYPLFEDAAGERVAGMIHLKDLLLARHAGSTLDDLSKYARPVQYVKPDMPALELFRRFRKGAPHFALVGHKNAKPIGFLTLDNLLGALVGQIHDEFRQGDADWTRMDDGTLMGKGSLPVVSLERALGIDIDEGQGRIGRRAGDPGAERFALRKGSGWSSIDSTWWSRR